MEGLGISSFSWETNGRWRGEPKEMRSYKVVRWQPPLGLSYLLRTVEETAKSNIPHWSKPTGSPKNEQQTS